MEKEVTDNITTALSHILSLARILEKDALEHPEKLSVLNGFNSEKLSLSQLIAEKAEFCLSAIETVEVSA